VKPAKGVMNLNADNLRLHMCGFAVFVKHNVVNTLTWMEIRKHNPFGLRNRKQSNYQLVENN
jgi:hypothetical protein